MTVPTGYRPRPWEDHLRLATALTRAPARVAVDFADDGWVCAHLAACGRAPVWASVADPRPVERTLLRLGLPPLARGQAEVRIGMDLRLRGAGRAQQIRRPAPERVDIVTSVSGSGWRRIREQLRTLLPQGQVIVACRTDDAMVRETLLRMPGLRVLHLPGASPSEALARAAHKAVHDEVLLLPEGALLLPRATQVLRHALGRLSQPGLAVGDALLLDEAGWLPRGISLAPRLSADSQGAMILRRGRSGWGPLPVLLHRSMLDPDRLRDGLGVAMESLASEAPTSVVPLWVAAFTTDPLALSAPRTPRLEGASEAERRSLSLVPEESGITVIVDDGDEGALGETLATVPLGARCYVLRARPAASDIHPQTVGAALWGGYGDLCSIPEHSPWQLKLSSDPAWCPPELDDPQLLVEAPLELPDAVRATAAVLGWPAPRRLRAVGRHRLHPTVQLARDARTALDAGERGLAFALGRALLGALPAWRGATGFTAAVEGPAPLRPVDESAA